MDALYSLRKTTGPAQNENPLDICGITGVTDRVMHRYSFIAGVLAILGFNAS